MKVYQFVSELKGFKPRVWRRFLISPKSSIAEFAYTLMAMYRMNGSHLYAVSLPPKKGELYQPVLYSNPEAFDDGFVTVLDATSIPLETVVKGKEGTTLILEYDFGDGWKIATKLEKVPDEEVDEDNLPRVLKGKYYGIIDDVGGVWGLSDLIAAFEEGEGGDYERYSDWLGTDEFDFTLFPVDEINEVIRDEIEDLKEQYENPDYFDF